MELIEAGKSNINGLNAHHYIITETPVGSIDIVAYDGQSGNQYTELFTDAGKADVAYFKTLRNLVDGKVK